MHSQWNCPRGWRALIALFFLGASLAWDEYRKIGAFAGHVPLMTGIAIIGLGACAVSLVKFGQYLRTDTTIGESDSS